MGTVCGFVFEHPEEKTLYWTGDTVLCEEVRQTIRKHAPEIIVRHAGGNRFFKEHPVFGEAYSGDSPPVIMDAGQVVELCRYSPGSEVVATHVGALDHETETRDSLRRKSQELGARARRLHIPGDGEAIQF